MFTAWGFSGEPGHQSTPGEHLVPTTNEPLTRATFSNENLS